MKTKLLFTYLFIFYVTFSFAQVTFNGNGNTGFGGTIGEGSLQFNDDGTTITIVLTKGINDNLSNALVLYLDTKSGGRNVINAVVNDNGDGLRTAISNGDSGGFASIITFPSGFEADYAIALDQNFAGLWEIPATGTIANNDLVYQTALNLSPTGTPTSATFTFDVDWSELGLTNSDTFTFIGLYLSTTAYNSDEGFGDGISSGTVGADPVTFTNKLEYPSGNVLSTNINLAKSLNVFYVNDQINIVGYSGMANLRAYDVFGKLIMNKEHIEITQSFSSKLGLPKNQLSFVVIETNSIRKVLKVIPY